MCLLHGIYFWSDKNWRERYSEVCFAELFASFPQSISSIHIYPHSISLFISSFSISVTSICHSQSQSCAKPAKHSSKWTVPLPISWRSYQASYMRIYITIYEIENTPPTYHIREKQTRALLSSCSRKVTRYFPVMRRGFFVSLKSSSLPSFMRRSRNSSMSVSPMIPST